MPTFSSVFSNIGNPLQENITPTSPLDIKNEILKLKLFEKENRLNPPTQPSLANILADNLTPVQSPSNLIDIAQSGAVQEFEQAKDFFNNNPDRTNEEIRQEADLFTGVTEEARQRLLTDPQQAVSDSLAKGNYLNALINAGKAFPGTVADSSGSILGIGAAAGVTAAAIAAAPVLGTAVGIGAVGSKIFKGGKTAKKVVDAVKAAKTAKAATKVPSLVDKTGKFITGAVKAAPKAAAQVSLVAASQTQRQINDFREKHGVAPTRSEIASMYTLTLATLLPQPAIFKNLVVPKFKKQIGIELNIAVSNLGKSSNFVQLAKRIASGVLKVSAAGSAEGVQEYLQTWAEAINVNIGPKDKGEFFKALNREFKGKDQQLEALTAGFLGIGAGSGVKAVTTAPAVAAGGALDVTKATAKGVLKLSNATGGKLATFSANKAVKLLSTAETEQLKNEFDIQKAEHEELVTTNNEKLRVLKTFKTFSAISDDSLRAEFEKIAGTDDLSDPRVFINIKNSLTSQLKADKDLSAIALQSNRIGRLAVSEGKRVVKNVGKLINITEEDIDRVVRISKVITKKTISSLKNFKTSSARGLIEKAIKFGTSSTKEGLNALTDIAVESTPEVIRKVADTLQEDMPKVSAELFKIANKRETALKISNKEKDSLITLDSLSFAVRDTVQRGNIPKNAISIGRQILQDSKGTPADIATIKTLQKALDIYTKTDLFKNQTDGALSPETVSNIKEKLEIAQKKHENTVTQKTVDTIKTAASHIDNVAVDALKKAKPLTQKIVQKIDDVISSFINSKPSNKTDNTVIDENTKTTFKIKNSPEGENFLAGLSQWSQALNKLEDTEKQIAIDNFNSQLSRPATIKQISETFETTDTSAIVAIVNKAFPDLDIKAYTNAVESALKDETPLATPETITRSNDEPAVPTGEIEQDEDGFWMIDEAVLKEDAKAYMKDVIGEENICGGIK